MLTAFVKGARRQLLISDVNLQDPLFIKLLEAQAAAGVDVRVIGKCKGAKNIDVRPLRRREVGVLITNAAVARQIRDIFEADWAEADSSAEKSTSTGRVVEFAAQELA